MSYQARSTRANAGLGLNGGAGGGKEAGGRGRDFGRGEGDGDFDDIAKVRLASSTVWHSPGDVASAAPRERRTTLLTPAEVLVARLKPLGGSVVDRRIAGWTFADSGSRAPAHHRLAVAGSYDFIISQTEALPGADSHEGSHAHGTHKQSTPCRCGVADRFSASDSPKARCLICAAADTDFSVAEAIRCERLAVAVARARSDRELVENRARHARALLSVIETHTGTSLQGPTIARTPARHVKWEPPVSTHTVPPRVHEDAAPAASLAWARLGLSSFSAMDGRRAAVAESSVVLVTLWRDPIVSRIIAGSSAASLVAFGWAVRAAFSEVIRKDISFFFIEAGGLWDQKLRIDSDEKLACIVNIMQAASPMKAELPSLFLYDDSVSPESSPWQSPEGVSPAAAAPLQSRPLPPSNSESRSTGRSSGSVSEYSARSTSAQHSFRVRVLRRDGARCVFCGESDVGIAAAHLVADNKHADAALLERLGLVETFDTTNGLALCNECHDAFDAHLVYVDAAGRLVVARALLTAAGFRDKWGPLQGTHVRQPPPMYAHSWPTPALFGHGKMLFDTDGAERRIDVVQRASLCPICHLHRFATARGLSRHLNGPKCREMSAAPARAKARLRLLRTPT